MIKRLFNNKTGVTILEGLIALGLLALVAGGTFGVLLSVSRKTSQPDIREEMILAIERANEQLQVYASGAVASLPNEYANGLCKNGDTTLSVGGPRDIKCMLPAICDRTSGASNFTYSVVETTVVRPGNFPPATASAYSQGSFPKTKKVTFNIKCNGFTL